MYKVMITTVVLSSSGDRRAVVTIVEFSDRDAADIVNTEGRRNMNAVQLALRLFPI